MILGLVLINFDEILPPEPKKIYIPRMIHPWKRQSFEKFLEKQESKRQKEILKFVRNLALKN